MSISDLLKTSGDLRMGQSGPVIATLQLRLRDLGAPLRGTGYFGGATDTAVSAFQRRAGLKADGVVGKATAVALDMAGDTLPVAVDVRPLWLQAGLALLGTKEFAGARDNQVILDWAHDLGDKIAKEYTHDSIPWCGLFAAHCLAAVGLKGPAQPLWALNFAGEWPSVRLDGPAVGAFAPMLRDGGGHIMQVVGRDQHGNVMGLGGNQHDSVSVAPFAVSRLNKGFWWPAGVPLPALVGISRLPLVNSDGQISAHEA